MIRNLGFVKKRLGGGDLFDRTRKQLTLQYSGVLIAFLSLFVLIVYLLLYGLIWNDQRAQLNDLADSERETLQKWVDQETDPNRKPPRNIEDAFSISSDQSFYYLYAENGTLQLGDELQPELRSQVMAYIAQGEFREPGIRKVSMTMLVQPELNAAEEGRAGSGESGRFLVADRELLWQGTRIGTLYIGKEVTFQHDLFRWLLLVLIGMALLFFLLALWFSHLMSRRAIVPVARAYARQREFVADASHELRTPLSVLLTSIEALQLEERADNDPFSGRVLNGMKEEVQSMTKLAGELLHLARSDSGDFVMNRAVFDARDAAEKAIGKLLPQAQMKQITLDLDAPISLTVIGDEEKLTQLLVLLIDNAIKYTPSEGFVQVRLEELSDKSVRYLVLEVKDNGIGMPPEALPRIFDRFYRQDKARSRQTGGHGLGLAIAKNIVDAGGGTIEAASSVGEGSTFKVRLPL